MMTIASLCPSNTELLDFIGLTPQVVGVDNSSTYPPEVNGKVRLGSDMDINMETLEQVKPDLVVASLTVPGMEKNIERLEERDMPFIILNPKSFTDIGNNMLKVGEAIGDEQLGMQAHDRYHALLAECKADAEQFADSAIPSVYWEWWPRPVFTPGQTNWLTELSEMAGAKNAFASESRASVQTDWDDVYARNPDYIFLNWVGVKLEKINPQLLKRRPQWLEMNAMKNKNVIVLGDAPFCRPSPRLLLGIKKVRHLLHPDLFPTFDELEAEHWLYGNA